jgi:hypothetical protein
MTKLPFSKEEQLQLLLARKLFAEIERLLPDEPSPWKLLTVTKADVLAFLESHPDLAETFFSEAGSGESCPNWHDVPAMWRDAGTGAYKVAWMNRGKPIDAANYSTIENAVANYIALRYFGG